jgi:predicted phosphoribosyltransferase
MFYDDRIDAGRKLAQMLEQYANHDDVIVLGLPRGGVPVAFAVARTLHVPMDIFLVRKLGVPGQEELAMGAVATGGVRVLNGEVVNDLGIPPETIEAVARREEIELERRNRAYRGDRPVADLAGKIVILVDDGLATGSSMRAAARAVLQQNPANVVIAAPVAAVATCRSLASEGYEVVCGYTPDAFFAVGQWYRNFDQTTDDEVHQILAAAWSSAPPPRM